MLVENDSYATNSNTFTGAVTQKSKGIGQQVEKAKEKRKILRAQTGLSAALRKVNVIRLLEQGLEG